jgi:2,5-furandicarboxylate decarboxylase 1
MKKKMSVPKKSMPHGVVKRLVDLSDCIKFIHKNNNLIRICSQVKSEYELAGIAKKYEGQKCVLFEQVKGSKYPVFIGMLWNRNVVGNLFGMPRQEVPFFIAQAIGTWKKDKTALPSQTFEKGPANEIIEKDVDLYKLPIPIHALKDGGRYLDSSVVVARNPETGVPNISIHRMMVTGKDRLTFLIDPDRHLGAFMKIAESNNKPLSVTINNGIGFAPWLVSAIPGQGDGKCIIANHIIGQSIPFIHAQTSDVPAYADAQFVIEAEIIPNVREEEGPFAEVTGYYASREKRLVMKVKAITHREKPIFHSLLSGQEVWNAVGFTAEAKIFFMVKKKVPQLRAVYLMPGGCGFYAAVVQVATSLEQDVGKKAIQETFKTFPPLQRVIAVDTDVDLYDPIDVDWAITTRFNPDKDLIIMKRQAGHILNPMVQVRKDGKSGTVTKMGIDATVPVPRTSRFERVKFKDVNLQDYEIRH